MGRRHSPPGEIYPILPACAGTKDRDEQFLQANWRKESERAVCDGWRALSDMWMSGK